MSIDAEYRSCIVCLDHRTDRRGRCQSKILQTPTISRVILTFLLISTHKQVHMNGWFNIEPCLELEQKLMCPKNENAYFCSLF